MVDEPLLAKYEIYHRASGCEIVMFQEMTPFNKQYVEISRVKSTSDKDYFLIAYLARMLCDQAVSRQDSPLKDGRKIDIVTVL